MAPSLPIVISIPHSGQTVPAEAAEHCVLNEESVFNESDSFTREIYGMADAVLGQVTQDVSRAVVDVNRSSEEVPPVMIDGAVKALTSKGMPVWRTDAMPDLLLTRTLIESYHATYHQRLESLLEAHRGEVRLFIDCHSMSPVGPPMAKDAGMGRPLICLSNLGDESGEEDTLQRISLPGPIILKAKEIVSEVFLDDIALLSHSDPVALNHPYKGGYITQHYSSIGFWTFQIELSKSLYLHPRWFDPSSRSVDAGRLEELNAKIRTAWGELIQYLDKA